mmetsp:Transcript_25506/g.73655  ORF Transcript_25506/g.73655 Transcript_25506/m.73655 type:complete len:211 (-) Transcript_25506:1467-2099(-)
MQPSLPTVTAHDVPDDGLRHEAREALDAACQPREPLVDLLDLPDSERRPPVHRCMSRRVKGLEAMHPLAKLLQRLGHRPRDAQAQDDAGQSHRDADGRAQNDDAMKRPRGYVLLLLHPVVDLFPALRQFLRKGRRREPDNDQPFDISVQLKDACGNLHASVAVSRGGEIAIYARSPAEHEGQGGVLFAGHRAPTAVPAEDRRRDIGNDRA